MIGSGTSRSSISQILARAVNVSSFPCGSINRVFPKLSMSTGTFIGPSKGKERRWDYQQCILVMVANGQDGQSSRNMLGGVGNRVTKSCERSIGPQRPAPYCEPHRQAFRRSTKFGFDVRLTISNRIGSFSEHEIKEMVMISK